MGPVVDQKTRARLPLLGSGRAVAVALVVLAIVTAPPTYAAESAHPPVRPSTTGAVALQGESAAPALVGQFGGPVTDILVDDGRVLAAVGPRIHELSRGEQAEFRLVGMSDFTEPATHGGVIEALATWDRLVLAAAGSGGLLAFNRADLSFRWHVSTPEPAADVAVVGDHAYIALGWGGVGIVPLVTDVPPAAMIVYQPGQLQVARVAGTHNGLVTYDRRLSLHHLADPLAPVEVSSLDEEVLDIAEIDDTPGRLAAITPTELLLVEATDATLTVAHRVLHDSGNEYVAVAAARDAIVVGSPERTVMVRLEEGSPTEGAELYTAAWPTGAATLGQELVVALVPWLPPSDPDDPVTVQANAQIEHLPLGMERGGSVRAYAVSGARAPVVTADYRVPSGLLTSVSAGGTLAAAAEYGALTDIWLFDMTDPERPVSLGTISSGGGTRRLLVECGTVYSVGAEIVVASPGHAGGVRQKWRVVSPSEIEEFVVRSGFLYGVGSNGLDIADTSRSEFVPMEEWTFDLFGDAIAIKENGLFLAGGDVTELSLGSPTAPTLASTWRNWSPLSLAVFGRHVFGIDEGNVLVSRLMPVNSSGITVDQREIGQGVVDILTFSDAPAYPGASRSTMHQVASPSGVLALATYDGAVQLFQLTGGHIGSALRIPLPAFARPPDPHQSALHQQRTIIGRGQWWIATHQVDSGLLVYGRGSARTAPTPGHNTAYLPITARRNPAEPPRVTVLEHHQSELDVAPFESMAYQGGLVVAGLGQAIPPDDSPTLIQLIDVRDPAAPTVAWSSHDLGDMLPGNMSTANDGSIYVTGTGQAIEVTMAPPQVARQISSTLIADLVPTGEYLVGATGLHRYHIADVCHYGELPRVRSALRVWARDDLRLLKEMSLPWPASLDLVIRGPVGYIAHFNPHSYAVGIGVVDLTDPLMPRVVANQSGAVGSTPIRVDSSVGMLFTAVWNSGEWGPLLHLYDLTSGFDPVPVSGQIQAWRHDTGVSDLKVHDNHVYSVTESQPDWLTGVWVSYVGDPRFPATQRILSIDSGTSILQTITVIPPWVFVTNGSEFHAVRLRIAKH